MKRTRPEGGTVNTEPLTVRDTAHRALRRAAAALALAAWGTAQAQVPADPYSYSRTSSFSYYAAADGARAGLLKSETVEPGKAQLCVTTTYDYDPYGNKKIATTANCAGATGAAAFTSRISSSTYAAAAPTINGISVAIPAGLFADSTTNALNHKETKTYDPRFGAPLSLTGPNGLTTRWTLDDFGRKVKELRADGTSTVGAYCVLAGSGLDASANSNAANGDPLSCPTPAAGEAPANAVMFTHSEPRDTGGAKMGPFVRVYSDRLGRELRSVTESFDGASQPGQGRLIVQDTDYSVYGARIASTQPYFLDTRSSTTGGTGDYGVTRTDYDVLGRPTDVYVADASGSQSQVGFGNVIVPGGCSDFGCYPDIPAHGFRQAAVTHIAYSGLTTITTNDKGQTRTEEKNPNGGLVRVTDATGAQLAHQRDAFGNLIATKDALQNQVTLSYDIRGRKVQMKDPDTGTWNYAYDALGQLVWQQSANQLAQGTATNMAYDPLGRMVSRVEPEYTSSWYYDKNADGSYCMAGTLSTRGAGKLCESNTSNGFSRKLVYDSLGRPVNSRTTVTSGPSFAGALAYNATTGRLSSQTYPTGVQVGYAYTARGFLEKLTLLTQATVNPLPSTAGGTPGASTTLTAGTVLWQAQVVNAWGRTEQQSYGNGVLAKAIFDAATGRTTNLQAGTGGSATVVNQHYSWDSLNNLTGRDDYNGDGGSGAVTETFVYGDTLNRLTQYTVSAPAIPGLSRTVSLQYNALGMLLYKSDVGNYSYGAQGPNSVRPHALQSVAGSSATTYGYDANGNLTSASAGKYRSISYTSFNLPDSQNGVQGAAGSPKYTWQYDENHARVKETHSDANGTRTTWYLHPDNQGALSFESETAASGAISNRHYLSAGGQTIAVLVSTAALPTLTSTQTAPPAIGSITLAKVEYWHKDHLGSLVTTSDHAGAVTQRYAYDPFGKRRYTNGQYDAFGSLVVDWSPSVNWGTDRGFTGHEHLDDVGLVHMNGRVFDPMLGVFLQGDPLIQEPDNLQNYNRYGYCLNNPLTCTDPSGYSWLSKIWKKIWHNKIFRTVAIAVAAWYTAGAALDLYASSVAAEAGFAASNAAVASGMIGSEVTAAAVAAQSSAYAAAASSFTGGMVAGSAAGFTGGFIASGGNVKEGLRGAAIGGLSGGIGNWAGGGAIGRMVGGGVNGYLQTGRLEGLARGFAAGGIPSDLGVGDAYLRDPYINVAVGILRDGIRGTVVADSITGFWPGVAYGQGTNAVGHLWGAISSNLSSPNFRDGAFFYPDSNQLGARLGYGAITIGNSIIGPDGLYSGAYLDPINAGSRYGRGLQWLDEHERGHITQGAWMGAVYLPMQAISQWSGWQIFEYGPWHPHGYETAP